MASLIAIYFLSAISLALVLATAGWRLSKRQLEYRRSIGFSDSFDSE